MHRKAAGCKNDAEMTMKRKTLARDVTKRWPRRRAQNNEGTGKFFFAIEPDST